MKRLVFCLFVPVLFLCFAFLTNAQDRYATCDQCGLCQKGDPVVVAPTPQSWPACCRCLYPNSNCVNGLSLNTLLVDSTTNAPLAPKPGRLYTMLGCLNTTMVGGFGQKGSAGPLVQSLLTIIFSVAGGAGFLYLLYGAFLILTSQSDPEKLNQGKRTVYGAIIGVIFSVLAVFLVNLIATKILGVPME